jgi:hypothetical protein
MAFPLGWLFWQHYIISHHARSALKHASFQKHSAGRRPIRQGSARRCSLDSADRDHVTFLFAARVDARNTTQ